MRGLEIRCKFALANVQHRIDPNAANSQDVFGDVYYAAKGMGRLDYQAGRFDIPCLFSDEPALSAWWKDGQEFAAELEEMASCSGCHDGTGNPCQIHG